MPLRVSILAAAACLSAAACGSTSASSEPIAESRCAQLRSSALASLATSSSGEPGLRTQSQCGSTLDLTPINAYRGEMAAVQEREDAVVLFNGCTGTLIAAQAGPVVITAGHCVRLGDRLVLAFNVEANADGDTLVTEGTVLERSDKPDYALIKPDNLPAITPNRLTRAPTDRLAIIQHARGGPKTVAEGQLAGECHGMLFYTDLDTLAGSSGAGVLTRSGYVFGVHTDGDCAQDGSGSNYGWTAASIVQASDYLQDADIADR
ncbi:trypsin-like serine peptidase [Pendulispora albinea]|uniref:Serine protease n=1 Tax=Pendulispora albinea TaxID=2741071 RepID=A0ABZ2M720_9BACT